MSQFTDTQSVRSGTAQLARIQLFFRNCAERLSWYLPVSVAMLVATLAPLLAISWYNHSYADDWHYGVWSHLALSHTGNIFAALAEGVRQVGVAWFGWQGTYSAILLMALQPGVFGEKFYVLAAPLVLIVLLGGLFYFSKVVLKDVLGLPALVWVSVASVASCVMLLLQPSPVEGIFWYNSAMYYSGFNAFGLFLAGQLITTLRLMPQLSKKRKVARTVGSCLLAAWFAGGNFVSLLVGLEVGIGVCLYLYATRRDPQLFVVGPAVAVMLIGAVVSFVAPGNAVRQATQFPEDKLGAGQTIIASCAAGFRYLAEWSGGLLLLGVLFVLPLFAAALLKKGHLHKLKFPHPAALTVCAIALFASSFTPTFYSMGTAGPGRVQDCRYELFVLLAFMLALYWCGWLLTRVAATCTPRSTTGEKATQALVFDKAQLCRAASAASVVLLATIVAFVWSASTTDETREELSSLSAAHSLATGQAQAYDQQVTARLDYLSSTTDKNVSVPFYTDVPHVLLMGDIRDNMSNYINYRLAQWFELDKIIGVKPADGTSGFAVLPADKNNSSE